MIAVVGLVVGVALLAWASDQLVVGAARIAVIKRVAPVVVGVVIVGFGTSSPEFLVSASAAASGQPEIAVGNIVGSNLVNLSLILGIGVLILPLTVGSRAVRREAPLTVAGMVLFLLLVQGGLSPIEGMVLIASMVGALAIVMRRNGDRTLEADVLNFTGPNHAFGVEVVRTIVGLIGTLVGAQMLLWASIDLADRAGLSEAVIGATIVAVGTSLPELVTVIQSARRGESDLILGNLLGSNLFNALAVGGVVGLVGGTPLDAGRLTGVAAAAVVLGIAVWVMMTTGHRLRRAEGVILVGAYLALIPLLLA
ncbi:MAG: calcium/sodium antiporter [Acidimicrobiia bacterium]|nr:calcium/sodium antiporter [Acidimicrobiia bacterium]